MPPLEQKIKKTFSIGNVTIDADDQAEAKRLFSAAINGGGSTREEQFRSAVVSKDILASIEFDDTEET